MKRNVVSKLIMNTLRKPLFDRVWQLSRPLPNALRSLRTASGGVEARTSGLRL
jgi:hypothetical protein